MSIPKLKYNTLNDKEKIKYIKKYHIDGLVSIYELSQIWNTYPNKIIRDCDRLGINRRNKSEAQKVSLQTGKASHPTEGRERTEDEKEKIGDAKRQAWKNLSEAEKKKISKIRKKNFKGIGNQGLRVKNYKKAAKEGSKLEKFLFDKLISDGYRVMKHKEIFAKNDKFHVDLLLPKLNVVIEVDGPTHFDNIWGEDKLLITREKDNRKTGLVLEAGMKMIRIVNDQEFTQSYGRDVYRHLLSIIKNLSNHTNLNIIRV